MFFLKQELGTVTVTVVTVTLAHENQYHPHFGQNHYYHQHHPSPPPTCAIVNLEIFIQLKFYLSCHPICNSCLELYIMLLFHLVLMQSLELFNNTIFVGTFNKNDKNEVVKDM